MKHIKKWILKLLRYTVISWCYATAVVLVLSVFGYHVVCSNGVVYMVNSHEDIGVYSQDGRFRLCEMRDPTNQFVQYSVVRANQRELLYTTGYMFHARFTSDAYWIEGTNDFCVPCSDSGDHIYFIVEGKDWEDPTWVPEFD